MKPGLDLLTFGGLLFVAGLRAAAWVPASCAEQKPGNLLFSLILAAVLFVGLRERLNNNSRPFES